jgi:hypothetical protein
MRNLVSFAGLFIAAFLFAGVLPASAQTPVPSPGRPLRLVVARQSTVPIVDIMKDVSERCPNVTITTNPQRSDYMLYAGGWSGEYRFMVIGHGGDTLYATKTAFLSNAVKDVCKFLNTRP